jgi:hypothetical protein
MHAVFALLVACGSPLPPDGDTAAPVDPNAITTTARPDGRSEVLAATLPSTGATLMFGGNDGPIVAQRAQARFRDDTWIFQPGVGWSAVDAPGPSARGRYGVAVDAAAGRALLFGGRYRDADETGDYRLFKDLWSFDFASRSWSEIDTGGGGPSGRYYPTVGWDEGTQSLYVFGGATNRDPLIIEPSMDLWRWTAASGWSEIATTGTPPSTRTFFGSAWEPAGKFIYLFGGQVGDFSSLAFQDTWALDVTTGAWTLLDDGRGRAPSTRMHAGLVWDPDAARLVLFGGHTDIGDGNDLWTFDPAQPGWDKVLQGDRFTENGLGCLDNPSEVPADYVEQDLTAPERRHRGLLTAWGGSLWIAGGMHSECSAYLDDTWRFDFDTAAWVPLIDARTGESCARRGDACECLCL